MVKVKEIAFGVEKGNRYGDWEVLGVPFSVGDRKANYLAVVQCKCGKVRAVQCRNLSVGVSSGCGCGRRWASLSHGDASRRGKSRLYGIWQGMRARCTNTKGASFKDYGGRGIGICHEWFTNYVAFRQWSLCNGYSDDKQIDRIDNDGNYEPSNCRWATRKTQCRNTRANRLVTLGDTTKCVADWLDYFGIKRATFSDRVQRGWSIEKALTQSVRFISK